MQSRIIVTIDGLPDDPAEQVAEGYPGKGQAFAAACMAAAAEHFPAEVGAGQAELSIENLVGPFAVHLPSA